MHPEISVCLCTYNGENYIEEQLSSILTQTYPPSEIIIVDDKSTDSTVKKILSFNNTLIKLYQNTTNLGYVQNFEKAISLSTKGLICLSDQDDVWYAEKIEKLVKNIGDNELIYHNSEFIDTNGNPLQGNLFKKNKFLNGNKPLAFVYGSCVTGHTIMFKKSILQHIFPFPQNYPHDWWIGYVASSEGSILYLDEILVKYRQHSSNVILGQEIKITSKADKINKLREGNFDRLNVLLSYRNISRWNREILEKIIVGYETRKTGIFSIHLFKILIKHYDHILALKRGGLGKKIFFAFNESFGEKIKLLFK